MRFLKRICALMLALVMLAAALAGYALFIEPELLITVRYTFSSPLVQKNARVVLFTDTHFGANTSQGTESKIVQRINKSNPDIVIFGGDLLDNYYADKNVLNLEYITQELSKIKAEHKIAVWGNHDSGGGASRVYNSIMSAAGFTVLSAESLAIEKYGVEIIGINDLYAGKPDKQALIPTTQLMPILVCHQPDIANEILSEQAPIMLSGHTHGGQVLLPLVTQKALPRLGKKYRKGRYEINGGSLFVSSGIGTSNIKVRFLNVPEIIEIEIVKESGTS